MVSTDYYQAMKSKGIVMLSSTPELKKQNIPANLNEYEMK